jgi:hypothetical protein
MAPQRFPERGVLQELAAAFRALDDLASAADATGRAWPVDQPSSWIHGKKTSSLVLFGIVLFSRSRNLG